MDRRHRWVLDDQQIRNAADAGRYVCRACGKQGDYWTKVEVYLSEKLYAIASTPPALAGVPGSPFVFVRYEPLTEVTP